MSCSGPTPHVSHGASVVGHNSTASTARSNSCSSANGEINPEDIAISDDQYPLLNKEQMKKVTSCTTCGITFSLIAEKLLHYTENLTCMRLITEKYKQFQVRFVAKIGVCCDQRGLLPKAVLLTRRRKIY